MPSLGTFAYSDLSDTDIIYSNSYKSFFMAKGEQSNFVFTITQVIFLCTLGLIF